jgi:type IV pilus assembly protein PilW
MRQNSNARSGLSQLQDQQRTAMTLIAGAIQQAGYFASPLTDTRTGIFPASQLPFTTAGTPVTGAASSFSVRYVTDPGVPMTTCAGLSATSATYVDTYSVSNGVLTCAETINGVAATTQSLVGGLSTLAGTPGMSIQFGIDTNGDGLAFQYQTPASTTIWSNAKSIKVTLNFANPLAGQPSQPNTVAFTRTIRLMNTP